MRLVKEKLYCVCVCLETAYEEDAAAEYEAGIADQVFSEEIAKSSITVATVKTYRQLCLYFLE